MGVENTPIGDHTRTCLTWPNVLIFPEVLFQFIFKKA